MEMRSAYRILPGKPEGMRQLERLSCRWKDNIEVNNKVLTCRLELYCPDMNRCRAHISETSGSIKGEDLIYLMSASGKHFVPAKYLVVSLVGWSVAQCVRSLFCYR
jgi:hypothetical protein